MGTASIKGNLIIRVLSRQWTISSGISSGTASEPLASGSSQPDRVTICGAIGECVSEGCSNRTKSLSKLISTLYIHIVCAKQCMKSVESVSRDTWFWYYIFDHMLASRLVM